MPITRRSKIRQAIAPREHSKSTPHWQKVFDGIMLIVAVIAPIMNIPQILSIIQSGSSAGVSMLSWGLYTLNSIPWLAYGIIHNLRAQTLSSLLWFLLNFAVLATIAAYR